MRLKRSMSRTTAIAMLSASAVLALAGPASAAQVHGLHLTVPTFEFTGGVCVDTRCDVTADGTATSQLTGTGSMHYSLIVDFFDGFDAPCNHVDETGTYTFADGTITITSSHTDCWIVGLRIFTTFAVTGGTGRYVGATGRGVELAGAGVQPPISYNGTISF